MESLDRFNSLQLSTIAELALACYLLLVLPAQALWRPRPKQGAPDGAARLRLYYRNILRLALLLLALGVCAAWSGIGARQLGVAWPPGTGGRWGLAIALLFAVGMAIANALSERRMDAQKRAAYKARLAEHEMMPRTPRELAVFAVLSVLLGAGWELLYRGFLMLVLPPVMGTAGAVILSALAYGAGHGYRNVKQFAGSIAAALIFTLGYLATDSLWWLIVIHIYLPLSGGLSGYRLSRVSED